MPISATSTLNYPANDFLLPVRRKIRTILPISLSDEKANAQPESQYAIHQSDAPDMKKYIEQSREALSALSTKVIEEFGSGVTAIKEVVSGLPVFVSAERTNRFETQYDEKHYFVIPYRLSETGFTLHTMRCLPVSVPEINDLPKRRIFHFPNLHYEASLREYMISCEVELSQEKTKKKHTLESLADDIDVLDKKLTYGLLLVGGVAAFVNPLVGAGIAAKALLPGVAGLIGKYGLRPAGQKMTLAQAQKAAREAEASVIQQFTEASTFKVVNPILQELELALRTTESQHDPLLSPVFDQGKLPELDNERWRDLTESALFHSYRAVYEDAASHERAGLGPEDLRWLGAMFQRFYSE